MTATKEIRFKVDTETHTALKAEAKEKGLTITALIKEMLGVRNPDDTTAKTPVEEAWVPGTIVSGQSPKKLARLNTERSTGNKEHYKGFFYVLAENGRTIFKMLQKSRSGGEKWMVTHISSFEILARPNGTFMASHEAPPAMRNLMSTIPQLC